MYRCNSTRIFLILVVIALHNIFMIRIRPYLDVLRLRENVTCKHEPAMYCRSSSIEDVLRRGSGEGAELT